MEIQLYLTEKSDYVIIDVHLFLQAMLSRGEEYI